jgi:hypothetical protein
VLCEGLQKWHAGSMCWRVHVWFCGGCIRDASSGEHTAGQQGGIHEADDVDQGAGVIGGAATGLVVGELAFCGGSTAKR